MPKTQLHTPMNTVASIYTPKICMSLLHPLFLLLQGYGIWYVSLLVFVNGPTDGSRALIQGSLLLSPHTLWKGRHQDWPAFLWDPAMSIPSSHNVPFFTHHFVGSGLSCGFFFFPDISLRVGFLSQHPTGVHCSLPSDVRRVWITAVLLESCGTLAVTN